MPTLTNHYGYEIELDFGAIATLPRALSRLGIRRPLVCTDRGVIAAGLYDGIAQVLAGVVPVEIYDGTPANPTEAAVMAAARQYRAAGCDGVVALGGGSPMDLAKGVALMATHDGVLGDWLISRDGPARIGPCAPIVAIPTTAGTGSEVGAGAVIVTDAGHKSVVRSRHLVPRIAICDPALTLGLPPRLTAATGMDAMTHCIEAVLSPLFNPPAEAIALDGLARVVRHLKRAVDDGQDREARLHLMMAASEGAMGFAKGLGVVHAMSHALGADPDLRLHHGTLNAILLPLVLEFNDGHVGDKYVRLRQVMGLAPDTDLAAWMRDYNRSIGIPSNLGELGVQAASIPWLTEHCFGDPCHAVAPRKPDAADYDRLFRQALVQ
jgi:4-hydroxybutyrate dehydrogenase